MVVADTSKPSALLIGLDRYRSQRALKGAEGDACDLKDWLMKAGVPGSNITCLLSSDNEDDPDPRPYVPMSRQVHDWLDALDTQARPAVEAGTRFPLGPRVYIVYAGHGYNAAAAQQTAIFPNSHNNNWDVLPLVPVRSYLQMTAHFEEIVVVSDACREPIDFAPEPPWMRRPDTSPHAPGVRIFEVYAARTGARAKEREFQPGKFRGVLTQAFLRGLRGAAREPNGNVTNLKMKNFIKNAVIKELGEKLKPEVNDPDDIVLCQAPEVLCRLKVTPEEETAGSATIHRHEDNLTDAIPLDQGERTVDIPVGRYTITTPAGKSIHLVAVWEDEHVVV